jgi:ADP-ribose pyrophosphatase YjhB (NUDIX family)
MRPDRFNIRVYALILDRQEKNILISDERVAGLEFSKFPGGGLEFGEGVMDCIHREAIEELGQEIEVKNHFYTTDFFQRSAFRDRDQLISIYYLAQLKENPKFEVSERSFDFSSENDGEQSFRWHSINESLKETLRWPVDKVVAEKLCSKKNLNSEGD